MLWVARSYSTLGKEQAVYQSTLICWVPHLQTRLTIQITPKLGKDNTAFLVLLNILCVYSSSKTWGNGFSVDAFLSWTQNFKHETNFNNRIFFSDLYAPSLENLVKKTTEHIAKVLAVPFIPARTIPGGTTTQHLPLETCSG